MASTFVATKSNGTRLFKIRYLKSKHYLLLVFAQKYNQSIGTVFIANIYFGNPQKKEVQYKYWSQSCSKKKPDMY